jgi:uncharacterized BrkB/YihY/UPF0761 family membrane protein
VHLSLRAEREAPRWRWITWGSAAATIFRLIASALFSWYAATFGKFNETYGSLGAAIGFMTQSSMPRWNTRPLATPRRARH